MIKELADEYTSRTESKLPLLPWYVVEYMEHSYDLSPASLLNYAHDYTIFFEWLIAAGYHTGAKTDIPLILLEKLRVQDITKFRGHLLNHKGNADPTINRKLSSLKSLFNYLTNKAEHEDLTPYLNRNVMAKIDLKNAKVDNDVKAEKIKNFVLRNDDFEKFREFVAFEFGALPGLHGTTKKFHEINRERDTAIVSLVLGSGLRVSELVGLNINDVNMEVNAFEVVRKGNKKSIVHFSDVAKADLQEYLNVRKKKYKPTSTVNALFLPSPESINWKEGRLTVRAVQKLVEKYAKAFGRPALTVHKLRHSFATRHAQENNNLPKLKDQLGHESVQTTMIYTHVFDDEKLAAVQNADKISK
ncbi:tyrosine recombinase XerS [Paenibacillus sp. MMO-177]|uniref:tyrosine recombinase XerS n=1 Tax=Paenibacillus sp. MMO-177 TaxID=3081289 RepID=UPI00301615A4